MAYTPGPILSFSWGNSMTNAAMAIRRSVMLLPGTIQTRLVGGVQNAIREIAVESLMEVTPVLTGALQASTIGMLIVADGMVTLDLEQPAENEQGDEYGKYVVLGHYTTGGTLVPPNPYPQEAMDNIRPQINQVAREIGQQIALDTVIEMGRG